jgi:hypothetical protein
MNQQYEDRNRLSKSIVLSAADLLEHYQWGSQSVDDKTVLTSIERLEKQIKELKETFRE